MRKTLLQYEGKDVVISLDSTGIKVTHRGEWICHKWKVRKGWIKVRIAVDVKTKSLLALEITDERTGDGEMLEPLVEKAKKTSGDTNIETVYGDGSYGTRKNFNYLEKDWLLQCPCKFSCRFF